MVYSRTYYRKNDVIFYLIMIHIVVGILAACDCPQNSDYCYCHNSLDNVLMERKIVLTLSEFTYEILNADSFTTFKDSLLVRMYLTDSYNLKYIVSNAFNELLHLETLHLSRLPLLSNLSLDVLETNSKTLRSLSVTYTSITKMPRLRLQNHIMEIIDFENNAIQAIESNSISVKTNQIIFNYNKITKVEAWAFNDSEISIISLKGNLELRDLSNQAFHGLKSLTKLDLSETLISNIPTNGLQSLETLIMKNTYSLKIIPSLYDFDNLKLAELTFSFHCCAFDFPRRHNPEKYAQHEELMKKMKNICHENSTALSLSEDEEWHESSKRNDSQTFINLDNKTSVAFCGTVRSREEQVQCSPIPNAFNPCEDIMGYKWLRFSVWFVVITGLCGNVCVLAVIICKPAEMTVQNFLISNLAFSDLCMAIFLLLLAVEDLISENMYFNYAYDWQLGISCKIAGFVTIFSCQMSIFILCLLTIERWYSIKRALYINQLTVGRTGFIVLIGWCYALTMASLPLLGVSSYSTTSLCLPMKTENAIDIAYVLFLLFVAIIAFIIICACYFQIYFSLSYETRHKDGEYVLARKMTILVATNFTCWAPITFFALTAVLGFPLINITNSKILLVFFYPLNSCANPFLYAILTTNFKRDFVYLLSKFGMFKETARKYKLTYYHPRGNSKHPIQRPLTSQTSL